MGILIFISLYLGGIFLILQYKLIGELLIAIGILVIPFIFITYIASDILGISFCVMLIFIIVLYFLGGYFLQEFPITDDLNNRRAIEATEKSNRMLEDFKKIEDPNDAVIHFIGDGVPLEIPRKINLLEQTLNRISYYFKYVVKYKIRNITHPFLLEYGQRVSLSYFDSVKYGGRNYQLYRDAREYEASILDILRQVKPTKLPLINKFLFIIVSLITACVIATDLGLLLGIDSYLSSKSEFFYKYFPYIIENEFYVASGVLFFMGVIYYIQGYFRTFTDGANARYQLLRNYMVHLYNEQNFIVFAWVPSKFNHEKSDLVVHILDMSLYSDIRAGFVIDHGNSTFIVIEPNLDKHTFYSVFARLISDSSEFYYWVNFFNKSENKKFIKKI